MAETGTMAQRLVVNYMSQPKIAKKVWAMASSDINDTNQKDPYYNSEFSESRVPINYSLELLTNIQFDIPPINNYRGFFNY